MKSPAPSSHKNDTRIRTAINGFAGWSALAGVLSPLVLAGTLLVATAVEWSFLRELGWSVAKQNEVGWPSILELGRIGWVVSGTFVVTGLMGLAFAASLYRVLPVRSARAAALLIGVASAALTLVAFNPDPPGTPQESWHAEIHGRAYPVIPLACISAAAILAWSLWDKRNWSHQARISLAAVVVLAPAFLLTGVDAVGQLARYTLFGTLLLWLELLALALLRVLRDARSGRALADAGS
jgi:hypothetical protein